LRFSNFTAQGCAIGYLFRKNSYLITFDNPSAANCDICVAEGRFAGLDSTVENAGENIRFNNGVFANSNRALGCSSNFYFTFDKCSFDYCGGTLAKSYTMFDLPGGSSVLNFFNCHFESGNVNDGWTSYGFAYGGNTTINLVGGVIMMGNANNYNNCPYFFYDINGDGRGTCTIDNTYIWGQGVQRWHNVKFKRFNPAINFGTSAVRGFIQDKTSLVADQKFTQSSIIDLWAAGGTRTSQFTSNTVNMAMGTTTDENNASVGCLTINRISNDSGGFSGIFPRPMNQFRPTIEAKLKFSTSVSSANMWMTVELIRIPRTTDAYGVTTPITIRSGNIATIDIPMNTTTPTVFTSSGSIDKNINLEIYDGILINFNFGTAGSGSVLNLMNLNIHHAG
jgi:hypothetical protein